MRPAKGRKPRKPSGMREVPTWYMSAAALSSARNHAPVEIDDSAILADGEGRRLGAARSDEGARERFLSDPVDPVPYRTRPIGPFLGAGST